MAFALGDLATLGEVFEHAPFGIGVFDAGAGHACVLHNEPFLELVAGRYKWAGSAAGVPLRDLFDEASVGAVATIFAEVRATGQPFAVDEFAVFPEPGDEPRYFRWSLTPLRADGRIRWLVVSATEVTDLVTARHAARESTARLRLALEAGGLGGWDWDVRSGQVAWTGPIADLLGVGADALDRSFEAFLALVHPDDRALFETTIDEKLAGSEDEHALEFRVVAPDGRVRWLSSRARLLRDEDGRTVRLTGIVADVTDRRESAERLQALARSEKLRALGQLAGGVAHDLNQSLALIAGYGDLARAALEANDPDPGALREMFEIITAAAIDGGKTVQRLLTFARSQQPGAAERVDLAQLLRDVAQLTAPQWRDAAEAEGRHVSLLVDATADATVLGSPSSLREAFTNLVLNAVDALPRGGRIMLSARRRGERVVAEVSDSGTGMPPEVQARVFEPFFTTKGERGTGLGLAQVYGIVEQHSGMIGLESAPGRGTTFRLSFPWSAAPAAAEPARAVGALPARPLRVLVVDDEMNLRRLASTVLEQYGCVATEAASAEEALDRLRETRYDVVVSDLGMGAGMNGWELAMEVRRLWPGIRFVLATGWGADIDAETARAGGVDAVVSKPYRPAELTRLLTAD